MAQTVHPAVVCMLAPSVGMPVDAEGQDLPVPQLVMLANVALTSEAGGCDYMAEEKQMVELKTVGSSGYSDSEDEGLPCYGYDGHAAMATPFHPEAPQAVVRVVEEEEEEQEVVVHRKAEEGPVVQAPPSAPEPDHTPPGGKRKRAQGSAEDLRKKKPFHCKPCQYQAESEEEFAHHIRVHSTKKLIAVSWAEGENQEKQGQGAAPANGEGAANGKGVIRCERCGYNTNRYDHYVSHLKHHSKEGESQRVYKCTICTYTTVSHYHWKKHLRNHFPSKLYTCAQCCYFSDRKNNYVQHIRTHTGERPFQCPYCQYTSSQKTHLTRHMRTHSGEKPFKCDNCSYVAANQHEVTRHARQVHGGPKPLSCPHCQYKTADRSNYKKHVELHVNPRQFLCPVCSYAASKKCNLQYHIKSRHPDCSDITMDVSKIKLRVKNGGAAKSSRYAPVGMGQGGQPAQPAGQEKTACGGSGVEPRQPDSSPINLSTKRNTEPTEDRAAGTKNKEEMGLKEGKKSTEEGGVNKAQVGAEKPPEPEQTAEQGRKEAKEEKSKRKERGGAKAAQSAGRGGGAEKQAEGSADQSEEVEGEEAERAGDTGEPAGKTRPKRERRGRKSNAATDTVEKEPVKESKNTGRTVRSTTKRPARVVKNTAQTDKEQAPESQEPPAKTPKKEVKTKAEKRKSGTAESPPPEKEISEQPASCTRTKSKRAEGRAKHPHQENVLQSTDKAQKGRRTSRRNIEQSERVEEPVDVQPKEKTKKTKRTRSSMAEVETANESKDLPAVEDTLNSPQKDDCPARDLQPVAVEEKDPVTSVQMTSQPQDSESVESLAKVDSVEKELENATAPLEPLQDTEGTAAELSSMATKQAEDVSEPKDAFESCSSDKELQSPPEVVPGPKQAEGKKPLPPLELPKVSDKPADTEEDEGIHSPDGSEISDSVSEGSDDSGLNGLAAGSDAAGPPEALSEPDTPTEESPAPTEKSSAPAVESPTPAKLQPHTCIFCDRTFPVEVEYRRHLNRHLVNVYYLEDAVREEQ
ncbi:RE1-silencing transcription factor-like [Megalops cyprinoides]|uniref:RE1-silencing transcription factor-like n=1 Tax=Megalops cyprinoides TaxID=118141 RepID=UPI001863B274|nr:RE1-silencing transcription factor-like [Megalops cyprinoides]XP_036372606.1 RE1-silencing transcription factor-like [Megalops cyprinoides]XP_036372607.1 RE1-silencing transcription factor-like [Megalops cyprinoides]